MAFRTLACLLALATLTASVATASTSSEAQGALGTAPLACVKGVCAGASCRGTDTTSCARGKCGWGQTWHVDGHYDKGNGTVTFRVACGDDDDLVSCKVDGPAIECSSDVGGPGGGDFGCFADLPAGVKTEDVTGFCKDPLNPAIVYLVVPSGSPYDAARNRVDLAQTLRGVRAHGLA